MTPNVSIIIVSFCRPHLLKWGLWSLAQQKVPFGFETIVVNDGLPDETEAICQRYQDQLHLKYFFSGQRNLDLDGATRWRVPGFAINVGVKQSQGDILILCCAEMFHLNSTLSHLIQPVLNDPKHLGVPILAKDDDGSFLEMIDQQGGSYDPKKLKAYPSLHRFLPFLMAVRREEFFAIGGYDEDFWGIGFDDNDFTDRLLQNGCTYADTAAETIHLYHPRYGHEDNPGWDYNRNLWMTKRGIMRRNGEREWGKL